MQHNHHPGILNSLCRISGSVMRLFHARLELALVESREEMLRLERRFVLMGIVGLFLTLGCISATALFVYLLSAAIGFGWALAAFTLIYFAGALTAYALIQRERKMAPEPFADTQREFEKDVELAGAFLEGREKTAGRFDERPHSTAPVL